MTGDLTIRQCAEAYGLTHRTLRFWEQRELIAPRRNGTARLYDAEQRARIEVIRAAQEAGLDLETIRDGLRSDPDGAWLTLPASTWDANATRQVEEMHTAVRRADIAESLARHRELRRRASMTARAA